VKAAENHVSDAQTALSDPQSNLAAKTTGFCKASQSYITALDGYGDVLTQSAPTVGDVKDAGSDSAAPTIGLCRIYVGAHLPLDVAGGAAMGLAVEGLVERLRPQPTKASS
jgi:hypothetical protein